MNKIGYNISPCAVLPQILYIIQNGTEYQKEINNIDVFRARNIDETKNPVAKEDFAAPPTNSAKSNRMSPEGVSYFYCSEKIDTPIKEIGKPNDNERMYIGQWFVKVAQKLVSFIPFVNNYWKYTKKKSKSPARRSSDSCKFGMFGEENYRYYDYSFWMKFTENIMTTNQEILSFGETLIKESKDNDKDYRPTQAVTAYLRAEMPDINGVEYLSVKDYGVNYCLFINHEQSLDGKTLDLSRVYKLMRCEFR